MDMYKNVPYHIVAKLLEFLFATKNISVTESTITNISFPGIKFQLNPNFQLFLFFQQIWIDSIVWYFSGQHFFFYRSVILARAGSIKAHTVDVVFSSLDFFAVHCFRYINYPVTILVSLFERLVYFFRGEIFSSCFQQIFQFFPVDSSILVMVKQVKCVLYIS